MAFKRIALLSIYPQYAYAILNGSKTAEFRKRMILDSSVSEVLLYATFPEKQILGSFELGKQIKLPPDELWKRFQKIGGIDKESFFKYYLGSQEGVAIQVLNPIKFKKSLSLKDFNLELPPQSFQYLTLK